MTPLFDLTLSNEDTPKPKLRVLDIGNNYIERIENLSHLENIEEFWVRSIHFLLLVPFKLIGLASSKASGNKITSLEDLEPQLANKESLETVYLEQNPVQRTEGSAYRRKIILALPQLKQIDAT